MCWGPKGKASHKEAKKRQRDLRRPEGHGHDREVGPLVRRARGGLRERAEAPGVHRCSRQGSNCVHQMAGGQQMSALLENPVARWPHQLRGVEDVCAARADGHRIIILTSPTGGGKTLCLMDLLDRSLEASETSVLYTNRIMLTEQTVKVM